MANILIVDDEVPNLNSLKRFLDDSGLGWRVFIAQNEGECRSALLENSIDVVISDLVMSTEDSGMNVLREAKRKDPLMMVILFTAFEKKLDRYKAFELGAFDCVPKNTPGIIAAEEILVKTKAALRFRELAISQIEDQRKIDFMKRYFDSKVFDLIVRKPDLLNSAMKLVTVVFWDIRGFSRLCENLKAYPTLVAGFLKDYFRVASEIIFKHEGVLDKFVGDGIMAIFGALNGNDPQGKESAARAVRAAIELRDRFEMVVANWEQQWILYAPQKTEIGIGCGIHTGESLVGNIGTDMRDQFTAVGPHVNFAQRIESISSKGQILISASTHARIKESFEMQKTSTVNDVKNIPGNFDLFEVGKGK